MPVDSRHSQWKGFLAGAIGGLAGSFAMSRFHARVSPKTQNAAEQAKEDSTVLAAAAISQAVFQHELTAEEKKLAAPGMHYAFGATMGAIYGTLVEVLPRAERGWDYLSAWPFG
jgi:hypothetical protein